MGVRLDRWPVHLTIVPPFMRGCGTTEDEVIRAVDDVSSGCMAIEVRPGPVSYYGYDNSIPVVEIEDTHSGLHTLRSRLVSTLGGIGCRFPGLYEFGDFSPHISHFTDRSRIAHRLGHITIGRKRQRGDKSIVYVAQLSTDIEH